MGPEIAIALGAGAVFFAGLSGVANVSVAYQKHVKNHQDGSENVKSGQLCSFVRSLLGCFSCSGVQSAKVEKNSTCGLKLMGEDPTFFLKCAKLLPKRDQYQVSVQSRRNRIKNKVKNGVRRALHRNRSQSHSAEETKGQVIVAQMQARVDALGDLFIGANSTHSQNGKRRRSPLVPDRFAELNMGKQAAVSQNDAEAHWATLQIASFTADAKGAPHSMAVVNWTTGVITMYAMPCCKEKDVFYRNYEVHGADLAVFETEFKEFAVYSGVIEAGKLTGTNSEIMVAKDDGNGPVKSENSWRLMGFGIDPPVELPSEFLFLTMKRATVIGILESLYERPTLLDVTTIDGGNGCVKEFVQVRAQGGRELKFRNDNIFTVFAFNARDYANEQVHVG